MKGNPGQVWKKLNTVATRMQIAEIISLKCGVERITTKSKIVSCFNHHFASISNSLPPANYQEPAKSGSKFQFDNIEELKLLSTLDVKKATGHDMISARLLRTVGPSVA